MWVITDGISRDFEHALNVMAEFELEYAELQYLWDKEVGDLDAGEIQRAKSLLEARQMKVACISRHNLWAWACTRLRWATRTMRNTWRDSSDASAWRRT